MAADTTTGQSPAGDGDDAVPYTQFACVGTGFSGIALGATLRRWYDHGDIQFFERNDGLGGTWQANRYPGCACDVPSSLYSLSFAPNPDWTRVLPPAEELRTYLGTVADRYDLRRRMRFGVEVRRAAWDEARARWRLTIVRLADGAASTHECQFLFSATGQLVRPRELDVPGVETFRGDVLHSARWRDDVELDGKRVVVFGNGCTGVQVVPAIVGRTKHLTHIVRSRHWILPGVDRLINDYTRAVLKIPGMGALSRFAIFVFAEDQLRCFYQNWDSRRYRRNMRKTAEKYMRKMAPEKYHDILIPDFEVGCKRRIFDPGYLESLHAENLELTSDKVAEIVPEGVKFADGRIIEADVIVACTGFKMDDYTHPMEIIGVGGETVKQHWAQFGGAPEAYNCSVMSGFPNFFSILGESVLFLIRGSWHGVSMTDEITTSRAKFVNWPHVGSHSFRELRQLRSESHQAPLEGPRHHSRDIVRRRETVRRGGARRSVQDGASDRMWQLVRVEAGKRKGMELADLSLDASTLLVSQLVSCVEGLADQGELPLLVPCPTYSLH